MRTAFNLLAILLLFTFASGCKRGDHDRPKTKADGAKAGGEAKKDAGAQNDPERKPKNEKGAGGVMREPKSLLGNARVRADQVARDNEMRQIALFYNQYCGEFKNPNGRTLDGFLNYIKRDSPKIHNGIKVDQLYTVNVKARLDSDQIIAYETEMYAKGFACIKANGSLSFVNEEELKAGLEAP